MSAMNVLKYLWKCIMDFLDALSPPSTSFLREILIGFFEIIIVFAVFVIHTYLINWYYSLLITISFVLSLILIIFVLELLVRFLRRYK